MKLTTVTIHRLLPLYVVCFKQRIVQREHNTDCDGHDYDDENDVDDDKDEVMVTTMMMRMVLMMIRTR